MPRRYILSPISVLAVLLPRSAASEGQLVNVT
jgi:hypothetical protein